MFVMWRETFSSLSLFLSSFFLFLLLARSSSSTTQQQQKMKTPIAPKTKTPEPTPTPMYSAVLFVSSSFGAGLGEGRRLLEEELDELEEDDEPDVELSSLSVLSEDPD